MPPKKWDKPKIISELQKRQAEGKDLSDAGIRKDNHSLDKACYNYFGNHYKALQAAGIPPLDHCRKKPDHYWTDDRIIARIRELKETGQPINARHVYKKFDDLYCAACKRYDTWEKAVEFAGYDYEQIMAQQRWPKKCVIAEIKSRDARGLSLTAQDVHDEDVNLYAAAGRRFGDWYAAVEAAGYSRSSITDREKWSRERILETLRELADNNEDLSLSYNYEVRGGFLIAACREFGTWENALTQIGKDYEKIRRDRYQEAIRGRLFETYLKTAFVEMKWHFDYHPKHIYSDSICVPDFLDRTTGVWYDAKVSPWGKKVKLSITKYQGHTGKLAIIYLRGRPRFSNTASIQFFSIQLLYPELLKSGAVDLVKNFESLRRGSKNPKLQKRLDEFEFRQAEEEERIIDKIGLSASR